MILKSKTKPEFSIQELLAPNSPWQFLGFVVVTIIMTQLTEFNPVGLVGTIIIFIIWWWLDLQKSQERIKYLKEQSFLFLKPQPPAPAKGLILLLSTYSPSQPHLRDPQVLEPLVKKIRQTLITQLTEEDFTNIDIFNSNLRPQIEAIKFHADSGILHELWFLATPDSRGERGSEIAAEILARYTLFKYNCQLTINRGQDYTVESWNYLKLCQIVQEIFENSGYKDEVIVADITGGTKMMSVALAMACISSPKRKMQYMDSKRDWQGEPLSQGEIKPILIDVDSIFHL
ncbi:MAG TPA: hypothetical protein DEG17_07265 [Cyanobacteria bacterium UBA11149]|nr:hypothetical protein [Cyanobacteria bacterium UBA11367]HBE59465.1 hypothetical protein [Cyanobacteria bacterium UBA11366]HBK63222.1 hypothetical protein [Cyanobacteria bacterium UBA11166]HBR75193.1 hypothetical protein [Cyanobacteria bacterium UBA11159]HBS68829.1 hypothetical protein [Cyanobacteria bacterium UBA11153]HBW88664.1 hypothetical protein [Cyanobacteria bacterium UBA11149]HCA97854.1 hypothetical protein [Cyanobacteria bacterium UBA9226]